MNSYFRVIRSALVFKVSKDVLTLKGLGDDDMSKIRVLARELYIACRLLDFIDNGTPFWSLEDENV